MFPSLADEIAEPRPDINIKVAAFTVSKKSINTIKVMNNIVTDQGTVLPDKSGSGVMFCLQSYQDL